MKTLLSVILLCGMACAHGMAQSAPKFTIVTKDRIGFSKGNDFYTLGTKLEEFRKKLGAGEKSEKDNDTEGYLAQSVTDYHYSDGFAVTAKDGLIIGFVFYPTGTSTMKAAPVITDKGIGPGASEKEIIKQYAEPYGREEYKEDATLGLYYKIGELVLSFRLEKGVLKAIGLNAGYLKYLERFRK